MKLWKISEKTKRAEGFNLRDDDGVIRSASSLTSLRIPVIKPMELMVEATPKRVFSNAHTYHINSISLNSDQETFLSADDLRINLWHTEITNQSFSKIENKTVFIRVENASLCVCVCVCVSSKFNYFLFLMSKHKDKRQHALLTFFDLTEN